MLPGARNLADLGKFFLAAHGLPVEVEHLAFSLKNAGYHFQAQSLRIALHNDVQVTWTDGDQCEVSMSIALRRRFREIGVARNDVSLDEMFERSETVLRRGIREYRRRITATPRAMATE